MAEGKQDALRLSLADQQQADVEKHAAPGQAKALLWDLLRPYRKTVFLLAIAVVLENAARLSVPRLVQVGVDDGVPPLQRSGDSSVLTQVVVVLLIALVVDGVDGSLARWARVKERAGRVDGVVEVDPQRYPRWRERFEDSPFAF